MSELPEDNPMKEGIKSLADGQFYRDLARALMTGEVELTQEGVAMFVDVLAEEHGLTRREVEDDLTNEEEA